LISVAEIETAVQALSGRRVLAFTGAGISVESGIPHFRGKGGLWTRFDPYVVASIEHFLEDPADYWTYSRNYRVPDARPNQAHLAIVNLERAGIVSAVVTQNTDGLHQKAGSDDVIELHGSSRSVICLTCEQRFPRAEVDRLNLEHCPPLCPHCRGRYLKPEVTFFGEQLPEPAWRRAQQEAAAAEAILVVGSSLQVFPAASIPRIALDAGAPLCIVNAEPTPLDDQASAVLYGKAGEILPALALRLTAA
jgi:NAD-dependent deacetylase